MFLKKVKQREFFKTQPILQHENFIVDLNQIQNLAQITKFTVILSQSQLTAQVEERKGKTKTYSKDRT
jgi:hypothetical protein